MLCCLPFRTSMKTIERIVTGRNTSITQIETLIHQLDDISTLTRSIGGGDAKDWGMRPGHCYDCWFTDPVEKAMKVITIALTAMSGVI